MRKTQINYTPFSLPGIWAASATKKLLKVSGHFSPSSVPLEQTFKLQLLIRLGQKTVKIHIHRQYSCLLHRDRFS